MIIFSCIPDKPYLRSNIHRVKVPDDKVSWDTVWPEYAPDDFTSLEAIGKPWAESNNIESHKFKWNDMDGLIDRRSHMGYFSIIFSTCYPFA